MIHVAEQSYLSTPNSSTHALPDSLVPTSLWRGILLVEPDTALLTAEVLLLTRSNYYVTPASRQDEIFALRGTKAIALAILSDCLGPRVLAAVAYSVRKQWPLARILVIGRPGLALEDHLYDERVEHSSDPGQLLEDIEILYKDAWNQRSHTLDWDVKYSGVRPARSLTRESDPTKARPLEIAAEKTLWDMPSGNRYQSR
jgi:hypothetical protein